MPCYDPRDDERIRSVTPDEKHMMEGGDILCQILGGEMLLEIAVDEESGDPIIIFPVAVKNWWITHQKRDAERKENGW
jgi:hypothetical protein